MATLGLIEYDSASPEVRAVYDDIMATRKTDWINNFWKAIAHDLTTLRRTWLSVKEIMAPGALDARTKEMLYLAVSTSNQYFQVGSYSIETMIFLSPLAVKKIPSPPFSPPI